MAIAKSVDSFIIDSLEDEAVARPDALRAVLEGTLRGGAVA